MMKEITYNKLGLIRSERNFNEQDSEGKELILFYLSEELVDNIKRIDAWLSNEKGYEGNMFDVDNDVHVKLLAKLDCLNEELIDIFDRSR